MVQAKSLQRALLPPGLLPPPSPGSLQSNRLAVHVLDNGLCDLYFASGARTYQAKMMLDNKPVMRGKDNLLIPTDTEIAEVEQLDFFPHRAEVQNISISEPTNDGIVLLGSVDSYGRIIVSCLRSSDKGANYTAAPQDAGVGEGGWAGLAFTPGQPSMVAVARSLAKSIDLYDKDLHVRTLNTLNFPTALAFLKGPFSGHSMTSVLATTEGSQLSIWDLRTSERGGCVQRLLGSPSGETLYAISSSSNGYVGTGGAERTAVIFDSLKWTALSRWTGCLKYEITGMSFSALDSALLYVHGLDYEVVCGYWNGEPEIATKRCFTFRGDSRWLGFNKSVESDVLAGWCESGSIFLGEVVSGMDVST